MVTVESLQTPPDQAVRRPVALWRNRDFLLLAGGQVVSSLGSQVSALAFPLLMLAVTGSPVWAGLLGALRGLPFVVFSLPVGALVDRLDRKRAMIVSDIGRAVALGSIPAALALGDLTIPHLGVVAVVEGTLATVFHLAQMACLPRVVPKEQLPAAVAQDQATLSIAEMVGPSLGGLLFSLGSGLPFLVDAVSFAASAVALRFIRVRFQEERPPETARSVLRRMWPEIGEGLRWLWGHPALRFLAVLSGGLNLFSFGYALIIILLAQQMAAPPEVIGLLFAAGGVGGVLGAVLAPLLQRHVGVGRIIIVASWVWAVTWPLYALAPTPFLLGLANLVGFVVVPIYIGTQYSYRLALIPDRLQGRVNSAFRLVTAGVQPLSLALTGALLAAVGPATTVWLITVPQVVLALAATLNRPLRQVRSLAELRQE